MSVNPSQLTSGSKVGPYTIRGVLGRGRNTEVYRASSPELRRDVALKVYRPTPGQSTSAQFKSEIGTIAALKHPNIIRIYDSGVEGDLYYITMELIEGSNLRDLLLARPTGLDRDNTLRLFSQLVSAVAYAHEQNVIHGNIKPDNVLLDQGQRPVLTDFNIRCLRALGGAQRSSTPTYLTPDPELLPQSDIYALGTLLYEMVTGNVPFRGSTYEEIASHHRTTPPRPPSQIVVGLDPRIERAILTALSKDPTDRYSSARDMLATIESTEGAEQFATVSLARDRVQKRRSEIKHFQQTRLDEPPEETPALPVPRDPLLWAAAGMVLLAAVMIIVLVVVFVL